MVTRGGQIGARRNRYNEQRRRREAAAKAAAQNAKFYDILSGAGRPPSRPTGGTSKQGRPIGIRSGSTGWVSTQVWTGKHSSDFRPQPIMRTKWEYQYQTGTDMVVIGKRGYGPGIVDARIEWKGEEDWKRKINAAYWGKAALEREAKIKQQQIGPGFTIGLHWKDSGVKAGKRASALKAQAQKNEDERERKLKAGVVTPGEPEFGGGVGNEDKAPGSAHANIIAYVKSGLLREEEIAQKKLEDMGVETSSQSYARELSASLATGKPTSWSKTTYKKDKKEKSFDGDWQNYWKNVNEDYIYDPSTALTTTASSKDYQKQLQAMLEFEQKKKTKAPLSEATKKILTEKFGITTFVTDKDGASIYDISKHGLGYKPTPGGTQTKVDNFSYTYLQGEKSKIEAAIKSKKDKGAKVPAQLKKELKDINKRIKDVGYSPVTQDPRIGMKAVDPNQQKIDIVKAELKFVNEELYKAKRLRNTSYIVKYPNLTSIEELETKQGDLREQLTTLTIGEAPTLAGVTREAFIRSELDKVDTVIKRKEGWSEQKIAEEKNKKVYERKEKIAYLKDTLGKEGVAHLNPEQIEPYFEQYKKQEKEVRDDVRGMYMQQLNPASKLTMTKDAKIAMGMVDDEGYTLLDNTSAERQQQVRLQTDKYRQLYQGNQDAITQFQPDLDEPGKNTLIRYRGRIRKTQAYIPEGEKRIQTAKDRLKPLQEAKRESNEKYSAYVKQINQRQKEAERKYESGDITQAINPASGQPIANTHSLTSIYDRSFGEELRTFADKREKLRYELAVAELKYEQERKDLSVLKEQLEFMKKSEKESRRKSLSTNRGGSPGRSGGYAAYQGASRGSPAGMSGRSRMRQYGSGRGGVQSQRTRAGYVRLGGLV